ncbi:hypothetical protein [Priestia megaterium]|nr:hypothetical protein [Priestia megaterium]MCT9855757.1 hypothetical protein [Priestia megaterium]MDF1962964.1 hypothetical protein [Priestia megaterium]MUL34025.1 hypothetical protein [Priestia megaterium]
MKSIDKLMKQLIQQGIKAKKVTIDKSKRQQWMSMSLPKMAWQHLK